MGHTENYLDILRDTLARKKEYLEKLLSLTQEQSAIAKGQPFDEDAFERTIDAKDILIDNVNEADKGFSAVYNRIRSELSSNTLAYRDRLAEIQNLIRACVDTGLAIEKLEELNRASLEQALASGFKGMNQAKQSRSVASKYYKSMSSGYVNDSFLYDRKK